MIITAILEGVKNSRNNTPSSGISPPANSTLPGIQNNHRTFGNGNQYFRIFKISTI